MKKAEVLAALAQVKDSQDLFVKSNAAVTLRVSTNTTKLPWKQHAEADELWFVYRGAAKVSLAPFSLQLGVTPPGTTYDVGEGDIVNVPRHLAYQIMPTDGPVRICRAPEICTAAGRIPARAGGPALTQAPLPPVTTKHKSTTGTQPERREQLASSPGSIASSSTGRKAMIGVKAAPLVHGKTTNATSISVS